MSPPSSSGEVLIVGMSRSGTTVIADILRAADNVHVEMEPHLIWKAGDFDHVDDEDHPRDENAYEWIRTRLTQESAGRLLIEKSPPNCLRPQTVHRVFPNARVIYVLQRPRSVSALKLQQEHCPSRAFTADSTSQVSSAGDSPQYSRPPLPPIRKPSEEGCYGSS